MLALLDAHTYERSENAEASYSLANIQNHTHRRALSFPFPLSLPLPAFPFLVLSSFSPCSSPPSAPANYIFCPAIISSLTPPRPLIFHTLAKSPGLTLSLPPPTSLSSNLTNSLGSSSFFLR